MSGSGRATAAGAVAAFSVVFAVPLCFLAAGEAGLGDLVDQGGFLAKVVFPAAVLGACIQALLVMRGDAGLAAPLAPLLPLGAGAAGFFHGGIVAFGLAPHDAAIFRLTVLGDSAACLLLGACFASVLWLGQAVAVLVAAPAGRPWSRAPAAAAGFALGGWTLVHAGRIAALRLFLRSTSESWAPVAQAAELGELEALARHVGAAAFAIVAVLHMLALARTRDERPRVFIGVGVAGFALLCALGAQALELYTLRKLATGRPRPAGELVLSTHPTVLPEDLRLEPGGRTYPSGSSWAHAVGLANSRKTGWGRGRSALIVRLFDATKMDDVRAVVADAAREHVDELVFVGRSTPAKLPASRALELISPALTYDAAVGVQLGTFEPVARVSGSGVHLEGAVLPFTEAPPEDTPRHFTSLGLEGIGSARELVLAVQTLQHAGFEVGLTR